MDYDPDDFSFEDLYDADDVYYRTCGKCGARTQPRWSESACLEEARRYGWRRVAASDRPEMNYRVVILNSPSVNAFALQNGQLYVTRGLIALANDTSELASVLAHEISHVVAQHAVIREEQAKQASLVDRVVNDVLSDPETGALALAKSKIKLASFSRAQEFEADGIGVGIASRAGYDPYGAIRFLTSMGRNAEIKSNTGQSQIDPRSPDFLSSHPATPERIKNVQGTARQFSAPSHASGEPSSP